MPYCTIICIDRAYVRTVQVWTISWKRRRETIDSISVCHIKSKLNNTKRRRIVLLQYWMMMIMMWMMMIKDWFTIWYCCCCCCWWYEISHILNRNEQEDNDKYQWSKGSRRERRNMVERKKKKKKTNLNHRTKRKRKRKKKNTIVDELHIQLVPHQQHQHQYHQRDHFTHKQINHHIKYILSILSSKPSWNSVSTTLSNQTKQLMNQDESIKVGGLLIQSKHGFECMKYNRRKEA